MRLRFAPSCLMLVCGCATDATDTRVLSVAAASSLRDVLESVAGEFEASHPDLRLEFAFEASSTIARQIEAGADYDVFLSADDFTLARVGAHLDAGSQREFLANRLVLVAGPRGDRAVRSPADLGEVSGTIAVALAVVPAGRYAREVLEERGLLARLEPRFVQGRNARATLALVASGAADYGFVYRSDHQRAPGLSRAWSGGPDEPPIAYLGAATRAADPAAQRFLDWLLGDTFQEAAAERGFARGRI